MITIKSPIITEIDRKDALSFLGYRNYPTDKPDDNILFLLDKYESLLLNSIRPRYAYKVFNYDETRLKKLLTGNDIKEHLKNCALIILMCVTLGLEADKLIVKASVNDLAGSITADALAGALVEQVCNICENDIKSIHLQNFQNASTTSRFSPGYGDFPIEIQNDFLSELDANRKIGLYVSESNILIPRKSVTAVIGLRI